LTSHRRTKNIQLTHLGKMPGMGGRFAQVGWFSTFRPHSLHVKSCSVLKLLFRFSCSFQTVAEHTLSSEKKIF